MAGIAVQLILSWIFLKVIEKQNLNALGIMPTHQRGKQFAIGLLIPLVFVSVFWLAVSGLANNPFKVNPDYTIQNFLDATAYVIRSVLFEELIFRGALLYILIQRVGATRAIVISAVGFGIYHWFSFGVLGQPVNMAFIFFVTGMVGYVLALGFYKAQSVYLPIALHFGYNFASMVMFSNDKGMGSQWLVKANVQNENSAGWITVLVTIIYFGGFPMLSWLYIRTIPQKKEMNSLWQTKRFHDA